MAVKLIHSINKQNLFKFPLISLFLLIQACILLYAITPSAAREQDAPTSLTQDEIVFLEKHPIIRFRVHPNRPPFEFLKDDTPAGIAVEYISNIAERTGFTPQFIIDDRPSSKVFEIISGARNEFDTVLFSVKSPERAEHLAYGDAYLSYPVILFTNKRAGNISKLADLTGKTVSVEKGCLSSKWIKRDYPDIDIIYEESAMEALSMVNKGKVEAYVGNLFIANYMMAYGEMENIRVAGPTEYENVSYRFVAPKELEALTSILSKGFRSITPEEHNEIQQKWFSLHTIEKNNYGPIWKTILAAAFITGWLIWSNQKLKSAKLENEQIIQDLKKAQFALEENNKKLKQLSVTDQLTGIYNRLKLESILEDAVERLTRYGEKFGIILVDIDHFKQVNDIYGHNTGDQVLIEFATVLQKNSRTVDTIGRWGGEEFIVICPHTDGKGIYTAAEHLRGVIAQTEFSEIGHKTASFGAAVYQENDTLKELVKQADEALYQSKEDGRNRVTLAPEREPAPLNAIKVLKLSWEQQYQSGHKTIDQQHKDLLEHANILMDLILNSAGKQKIKDMITVLSMGLAKHFAYEEKVLANTDYQELAFHKKEHKKLMENLEILTGKYFREEVDAFMFMKFVAQDLILNHMIQTDTGYFDLFPNDLIPD